MQPQRALLLAALLSANAYAAHNAQFISQSVINSVGGGKKYEVAVTFKNTGTTAWSGDSFRLGSQNPADNWNWNDGRVHLDPGETVAPGATKTFKFVMTAPGHTSSIQKFYNFQWRMLQEGVTWFGDTSTNVPVEVFYAPDIRTNFPPARPPAPVTDVDFSHAGFRGANLLESATPHPDGLNGWFPTADKMRIIAKAAQDMNLNYLRHAVALPRDGYPMEQIVAATREVMDIAHAHGLRVILVLAGYDKYSADCDWESSFLSVQNNAATFVSSLYSHPALLAWDLNNEPLWYAAATFPSGMNPDPNNRKVNCLYNGDSDYQQVVDGVHAMYNLVRQHDPSNKPTTVGEAQIPFIPYWKDISSFASPHLYMVSNPKSPNYELIRSIAEAGARQLRADAGGLPTMIGEYGFAVGGHVRNDGEQANAYQAYLNGLNGGAQNMGSMFWSFSLSSDQQPMSLLNLNGSMKQAAHVVKNQAPLVRNAAFVSQSVPALMLAGQTYPVSITLRNTGTTNWAHANYRLGSQNPADNGNWGLQRVGLNSNPSETILPGQQKTFNFSVKAPAAPGAYNFQWRLLQEGVEWFGATTPNVAVTVQ
ncbi:NBR1-Ig-like domain-containing protein [Massilia sp. erpn]|uniref:NBR1-Ig-like domain-containing protein n=1 Tax=Massilia sp. erpn TaxID=2738142 RepID=UPI002107ECD5|nr:NBR1-Ig-like domain-containing protein [Massilia sp. erpn]UTY58797.1 hypothetical protein HPQ68_17315 [Massilia sp. erpn]